MVEEVVDAFLFHEPAGEVEVGLAVLHAIVARLVGALELPLDVESLEHFPEDVRHGLPLEDPALRALGEKPELGNDVHLVGGEQGAVAALALDLVAAAFRHPATDSAEVAVAVARDRQLDGDAVAEQTVEGDLRVVLGEQVQLEAEELRNALETREAHEQHRVFSERRAHHERPVRLDVCRHRQHSLHFPSAAPGVAGKGSEYLDGF